MHIRKRVPILAAALVAVLGIGCGEPARALEARSLRQGLDPGRLGEPVSEERAKALIEAGWLRAVISVPTDAPVDIAVPNEKAVTGYSLIGVPVPLGAELFINPENGRVIYQDGGYPGLVYQLVEAGYDFKIVESRSEPPPSREELGKLLPVPQSVSIHPVIEGGLTEEQVKRMLEMGWKPVPFSDPPPGAVLFRDPQYLGPEGLYLGWAAPDLRRGVLMLSQAELPGGGDCTCVMPECGNKYKCPCVAVKGVAPGNE